MVVLRRREDGVFLLFLNKSVNGFDKDLVAALRKVIAVVNKSEGEGALVTISCHPTVFCAGVDLKFMTGPAPMSEKVAMAQDYQILLGEWLSLSVPTVAIVNGHAIAASSIFAFAHDYRVMRQDQGVITSNELQLGMSWAPGPLKIVESIIGKTKEFRDLVYQSPQLKPQQCLEQKWVDQLASKEEIFEKALAMVTPALPYTNNRRNFQTTKEHLNRSAIDDCITKSKDPNLVSGLM